MTALDGIRVIDLSEALAGPYCAMILGDLGADVIKVERPGHGDQSRRWGPPFVGSESAYYLAINRNKRSLTLDFKSEEGREQLRRLLETADVFVCNLPRGSTLRDAHLLPETVRGYNPRLIYCSITAYGRTGPYSGRTGYDLVAQGEAGLMAATGDAESDPMRWPVASADLSGGLWSALSILAALHVRDRTGVGQFIDQSLLEAQLSWAPVMASQHFASGARPARLGNRHPNIVPYEVFAARDKHLIVAVGTEGQWHRLCDVLALGETVRDDPCFHTNAERVRHRTELKILLDAAFAREDAAEWLRRLRAADVPCGPVNALDEALRDPHVLDRRMVVKFDHPMGAIRALGTPIHLSATPVSYRRRPPLLGEHTDEVLREAGWHRPAPHAGAPARGPRVEPAATLRRPPRYAAELALRVALDGTTVSGTTLNVSEGGCAVRVNGLFPLVGDELRLDVRGSIGAVTRAVVCWSHPGPGAERTVGLRVADDWRSVQGWRALVLDVVRSGARAA
jgi:crotonobetainyl-CoA:carnitine CoA-transferase CaiB-like acyl-CoA transferase